MLKLSKTVAAAVAVFFVLVAFAIFSSGWIFFSSEDLQVQKLWSDTGYRDQYVSLLNDSSGNVGEITFTINKAGDSTLYRVWVDISHNNNTLLDSVVFKFSNPVATDNIAVYVEANHPEVKVNSYLNGSVFVIGTNPEGIMQQHTLHMDFVVETFGSIEKLQMGADLKLHQQTFLQLTQMRATITIDHNLRE